MNPKEVRLKDTFLKVQALTGQVKSRKKQLMQIPPDLRRLVSLSLKEGPAEVLRNLLSKVGSFSRTSGGELLFFREGDHCLYDIEGKTFERYLIRLTGNVTGLRHQWLPRLQAWARFEAAEVKTHFLAYNDSPDLTIIAINTFDGHMMLRKRSGTWQRVPNGTNGILFLTPPEFLAPWAPRSKAIGQDLEWLCSLAHFSEDGPLTVADQRLLLQVWLLHLFFPALNPVHPILLHEGVTGSGKTVLGELIGRWLTGPEFEVTDLPSGDSAKAEETLKLALCKRHLVAIDNVDSPSAWLEDFLCRVATGVRMSRRRLYTNAEEVFFIPRAGLIVTSRDPHFRREDLARRLLPLRFKLLLEDQRRSETELRKEVDQRRAGIWADVLDLLARGQDAWPELKTAIKPSHSLADFSVFGALVVSAQGGSAEEWQGLMGRLEQAQRRFTVEEDPLIEVLAAALHDLKGVIPQQPVSQLFGVLRDIAQTWNIPWPFKAVSALTNELKNKRGALEQALGIQIVLSNRHHGGVYQVAIQKIQPTSVTDKSGDHQGGTGGNGGTGLENSLSDGKAGPS